MRYCGVVPARDLLQLVMLEEAPAPQPPGRLVGAFYEPGSAEQVGAEVRGLPETIVAVGAPLAVDEGATRMCDELLRERGVPPQPAHPEALRLASALGGLGRFTGEGDFLDGPVPHDAVRGSPVFETNADAVFCALGRRRLPARRHPLGVRLRIGALLDEGVVDDGGDLWHRRIEELDAAAAAICAHRYATGHACWLGRPTEAVVVLPGAAVPRRFATEGVIPPVERLELPPLR